MMQGTGDINLHDVADPPMWTAPNAEVNQGLTSLWGKSFYVLNGAGYGDVCNYLAQCEGEAADTVKTADCVVFTGGADVSPSLYGETAHPTTCSDPERDEYEKRIFDECVENDIPMLGICRGSQFLNVMNGGSLWQNVDGHALSGTHTFLDWNGKLVAGVTSTHHQISRLAPDGLLLGSVCPVAPLAKVFEHGEALSPRCEVPPPFYETEAFYYPETRSLGIQGHPEWAGVLPFAQWASLMIWRLINDSLPIEI